MTERDTSQNTTTGNGPAVCGGVDRRTVCGGVDRRTVWAERTGEGVRSRRLVMPPVISEAKSAAAACGRSPQQVMQSHPFLRMMSLPEQQVMQGHSFLRHLSLPDILPGKTACRRSFPAPPVTPAVYLTPPVTPRT